MKNSNKKLLCLGAIVVLVVAVVIGVVMINNTSRNNTANTDGDSGASVSVRAEELNNPTTTIVYGDYGAMETLAKAIQNGEKVGEIVSIEGLVSHPGDSYSVVEADEESGNKIGTVFEIEGDEVEYPADGTHVTMLGKVVEKEPMVYIIKTVPGFVMKVNE